MSTIVRHQASIQRISTHVVRAQLPDGRADEPDRVRERMRLRALIARRRQLAQRRVEALEGRGRVQPEREDVRGVDDGARMSRAAREGDARPSASVGAGSRETRGRAIR